jgi:uncharacterized membrane protein YdjX (TVP38/TMEM64 family)
VKAIFKHRLFLPALAVCFALGLLGVFVAWKLGLNVETLKGWIGSLVDYLEERPALIFIAIVILPSMPFPVSVLLLAAGVVYGERYGPFYAGLIALTAIIINFSWTYWFARFPARRMVERIVRKFDVEIPELPKQHVMSFTLVFRITPGIPFFLQNYVLGLARVPFRTYFIVSLLAQTAWTFGFVISGGAIFEGNFGLAITGCCLLTVATLITQSVRKRLS